MLSKREVLVKKAEERGYKLHNVELITQRCNLIRPDGVGLIIWPETEEFEIYYNIDLLYSIKGGKCGSFLNDRHFKMHEDKVVRYAHILQDNL